jgi:hypothetical protein
MGNVTYLNFHYHHSLVKLIVQHKIITHYRRQLKAEEQ